MHRRYRLPIVLGLFLILAIPSVSFAIEFVSTDLNSDELVKLDSTTGTLTVIGSIGFNFGHSCLATLGTQLYATNSPTGTLGLVTLVEINPLTGAMISSVTVKNGATNVLTTVAEGFTSDGTTLMISYNTNSSFPGGSHSLADLSTSGQISNSTFFGTSRDMDNIASLPGGPLYGADGVVLSPNNRFDLYNVARPSTFSLIGSHFVTGNDGHNGMVFDTLGNLWTWSASPDNSSASARRAARSSRRCLSRRRARGSAGSR